MFQKIIKYSLVFTLLILIITLANGLGLMIGSWREFFDQDSDYNLEIKSYDVSRLELNAYSLKDAPIFYSSRKFYIQPAPSTIVVDSFPALSYVGSIKVSNDNHIGMVINQNSNKTTKIKVGDVIEEWIVTGITGEKINFEKNNSKHEILKSKNSKNINKGLTPPSQLNSEIPPKYVPPTIN